MKYNILLFVTFVCLFLPATSHAGDFVNLVGVPGLDSNGLPNLNAYINALYRLSISIAALLAVIKIVIAGAKYMLSDIVTHKEDAKKDIQGALIGLLIVIGAVIILNTINTDLTNLDLTIDTATITQDPMSIQALIARQQQTLEERAEANQAPVGVVRCTTLFQEKLSDWTGLGGHPDVRTGETNEQACARICRQDLRGVYTYNVADASTCDVDWSQANLCNPQTSATCCEEVKGGTSGFWGQPINEILFGNPTSCNGLTEGVAARRAVCITQGRLWRGNDATGYCSTQRLPTTPTTPTSPGNTDGQPTDVIPPII